MRYVALYRRSGSAVKSVIILKDARIRQIAEGRELGIDNTYTNYIQIERVGWGYDYYSASAYRALEVEKICQDEN
jgi:hypothetical protein